MKQCLLFLSVLVLIANGAFAQVDKAKELLKNNRINEAKTTIDDFLKDPANQKNAEAWYTKSKIYIAIAADGNLSKQFPSSRKEAFNALQKYTETDDKLLINLQIDGYAPINEIYTGFYQLAANSFNTNNYGFAYDNFVNAIEVSNFMNKKGWIKMPLDTNAVLYAGVSAEKLNRIDDAVKHYGQLVEARAKGQGFIEIYKWVANYYYEKKNAAQANKFLAIGREVYPNDPFWNSLAIDMSRDLGNKDVLFAQYEKTIAAEPNNHLYRYNYAVELYQAGYNVDLTKRPANSEELIQKAETQLLRVVAIKPDYAKAQLFAGQVFYNKGVDYLSKSKTTQGDNASVLKSNALAKFEEAMPFLLKVEQLLGNKTQLAPEDKSDLKEALDLLITIYDQKGNKEKVKEYDGKFKSL